MLTSETKAKRAFTLLELLIVIAGIGALMAVVLVINSGATEGARAAKCKSHMRNLAQAVQSYAISHNHYPNAGSYVYLDTHATQGKLGVYKVAKGWIGLNRRVENSPQKFTLSKGWNESCMNNEHSTLRGAYYAITNGTLWSTVHDLESYICPEHRRICRKNGVDPLWTYVMNSYFGYDNTQGNGVANLWDGKVEYGKMGQAADLTLLFAEIPFVNIGAGEIFVTQQGPGHQQTDCTLQFRTSKTAKDSGGTKICNTWYWDGSSEMIGFNHKVGKNRVAHVVFADSHVEELIMPVNPNENSLKEITACLCNGRQLTYVNGHYVDPDNNQL